MFSYHFRRLLILVFASLYLFNYFFPLSYLHTLNGIILVIVIAQAFPHLPPTNRRVCLSLVLIGGILLLTKGAGPKDWLAAVANNAGLVTLFVAVPLMSLPFFYEDYQLELRHLAQRYMTKPLGFCGLTSVVAHGASVLINIAAIPLVYELLKGNAELYRAEKPFLASLLRGYMTSVFWSPNWVSVAAVTYYLKLPWLAVVPMGLLLTLITIGLSLIWIYLEIHLNPNRYQELENDDQAHIYWPYIYTLIILAASLMSLIVVLNLISTWQILIIAPIAALLFAPVTALLQKKVPKFKKGLHNYYHNTLVRIKSEMTLFTAAGFLGAALKFSGISQALPQYLPYWLNEFPFISILAVMLIIVLPALAGIHPVVAGTAVVSTINPLTLDLTPMIYGGTVLAGWGLAVLVSPFSAMSLVTAGMIGSSSWEIGLKLNGLFGLLLLLSLASALTFIHYMF